MKQLQHVAKQRQNKLDFLDLKILEGLGTHYPRNVTDVARKLGIPAETLRKRLKHMLSNFFMRLNINIYHTNLGLKKAVVFTEAIPGYEDLLFRCLKTNAFWIYLSRCYGMKEGCFGIYTVPRDHCTEFEQFLQQLQKMGVTRNVRVFWSTCFQSVNSKCTWFDRKSEHWVFRWGEWIEEIPTKGTELPYTLVDPEDFPIKGDKVDVFILKELEKNATISFVDIAKMLNISPQLVGYHYQNHIVQRGLIESFEVTVFYFGKEASDMFYFILKFKNMENLARFALSLLDKPFVWGLGKILGENALLAHLYLPKKEFRKLIDTLSKLIRTGFLQTYDYIILDLEKASRQTISYEYFKDGSWLYNHKNHIGNLQDLVKQTPPEIKKSDRKMSNN